MKTTDLLNYARDQWTLGTGQRADIASAIDGSLVATTGSGGIDFAGMLDQRPWATRGAILAVVGIALILFSRRR